METIAYKIMSGINLVGCVIAFAYCVWIAMKYKPPLMWQACVLMKMAILIFGALNQLATLFLPISLGWELKFIMTGIWVFAFMFMRNIRDLSTKYVIIRKDIINPKLSIWQKLNRFLKQP